MYTLIAVLGPSVFGVKIIDYFNRGLSLKNTIYYLVILLLFSSVINNVMCYVLFDLNESILGYLDQFPILFCKFALVSIVVNCLLALMVVVIMKNVVFSIEVKNEKVSKKSKRKRSKGINFFKKFFKKNRVK